MSDGGGSSTGGSSSSAGEVVTYACRLCPGTNFTAAERDIHRRQHKTDGTGRPSTAPGPASKKRRRGTSPAPSSVTLFTPHRQIPVTSSKKKPGPKSAKDKKEKEKAGGKKKKAGESRGRGRKKISTKKNYDDGVDIKTRLGSG